MDGNNWRAAQAQGGGGEGAGADAGAMDSGDWRTQLLADSRQSIVNKIMETLKRHLPVSGQEGVQELKKIAVRFEEKIYSAATSQQDYLQKISLKMLTMETKSQNPIQPNPASSGQNPVQQQMLQNTTTLLPSQGQMMSQSQSQPGQLPPPLGLQQQTNLLQREMQQRLQLSAPLLQQQNVMEQQKQLYQSRAAEASSTSLDSTAQTGNANAADWQEEVYQKIKSMRDSHLAELNDLYHKIASKVQQHGSLPQRPQNEQIEKLKVFKVTLERIVLFLRLNKQDIQPSHREKLVSVEKHISFFLSPNRLRSKPSSSPLQGQSSMQLQQPQSLDGQTNPSMQPVQGSMSAMPQNNLTNLQNTTTLLPSQGQQSQSQPAQQQMMSQSQSQPGKLPPPLGLQQQTNQLQREMQQRLQPSAPLLQQQNVMEQQKQLYQSRAAEASSTSLDSTAQTGNENAADWQEEVYQKIKSMRDSYLAELNDLYHKIASKVQQHDFLPQRPQNEQIDKLKVFKVTLERIVLFLRLNKQDIQPSHKEKLVSVEKHISFFLSSNRPRSKPSSSPL